MQNGEPPPPELRFAQRVQMWGDPTGRGWMEWPAGMVDKATAALNTYRTFQAYEGAGTKKAAWSKANPGAWQTVSWVIAERINGKRHTTDSN